MGWSLIDRSVRLRWCLTNVVCYYCPSPVPSDTLRLLGKRRLCGRRVWACGMRFCNCLRISVRAFSVATWSSSAVWGNLQVPFELCLHWSPYAHIFTFSSSGVCANLHLSPNLQGLPCKVCWHGFVFSRPSPVVQILIALLIFERSTFGLKWVFPFFSFQ